MLVVVGPAGVFFFGRFSNRGEVAWFGPWILVVVTASINMVLGALRGIPQTNALTIESSVPALAGAAR